MILPTTGGNSGFVTYALGILEIKILEKFSLNNLDLNILPVKEIGKCLLIRPSLILTTFAIKVNSSTADLIIFKETKSFFFAALNTKGANWAMLEAVKCLECKIYHSSSKSLTL